MLAGHGPEQASASPASSTRLSLVMNALSPDNTTARDMQKLAPPPPALSARVDDSFADTPAPVTELCEQENDSTPRPATRALPCTSVDEERTPTLASMPLPSFDDSEVATPTLSTVPIPHTEDANVPLQADALPPIPNTEEEPPTQTITTDLQMLPLIPDAFAAYPTTPIMEPMPFDHEEDAGDFHLPPPALPLGEDTPAIPGAERIGRLIAYVPMPDLRTGGKATGTDETTKPAAGNASDVSSQTSNESASRAGEERKIIWAQFRTPNLLAVTPASFASN